MRMEIGHRNPLLSVIFMTWVVLGLGACSSILPREEQETISPWEGFDQVKKSFDNVVPGETSFDELKKLGFNPEVTPNIKRITYIDLLARFLPNQSLRIEDVDPRVSQCIRAREDCYGLEITPGEIDRQRFGNAFLDVFGFKRRTRTTGWRFDGLIVLHEDLVVYKLAGGNSNINQIETRKRPLGPLQEIDIRGNVDI